MKTIMVIALWALCTFNIQAQTATLTLSVKGNCEECKARIENAADIKGVKICTWNEKTQVATIIYKTDKVSPAQIEKAILAAGHDVGKTKADAANYNKLPNCCKFRDKKCEK